MADQLATPEDLACLLERDDIERAKAELLIECATAVVQAVTGQRIVLVNNETVTFDLDEVDHGPYLMLPERPIINVSAVRIGALPVTDYTLQARRARLWRRYGWRSATTGWVNQPYGVTVTYSHGYAPTDQRLQLARQAVLALIKGAYGNSIGASQLQLDDFIANYGAMSAQMDASPFLQTALRRRYGRPTGSAALSTGYGPVDAHWRG
ncbi:MAG TPA: hypothetical protein VE326_11540 [Candidatus Binatia bacterium]|nr:hypothetical protein [Candidatus Binatia bacterium]